MHDIPVILLAAGESSRMGCSKQLLPWGDHTLIEHQIKTLQRISDNIFVVLGANATEVIPVVQKYNLQVVLNSNWRSGMGTSVSAGIAQLIQHFPSANGVLFALTDQPFVEIAHYQRLRAAFRPDEKQIVISQSPDGWLGVPALFDAFYFDELSQLSGTQGAKTLFNKYASRLIKVEGENKLRDIDTPEDYLRLKQE